MSSRLTTYQHDYPKPGTNVYKWPPAEILSMSNADFCEPNCFNSPENKRNGLNLIHNECENQEWTGIGPMAALIKPQLIPSDCGKLNTQKDSENDGLSKCNENLNREETNKMLQNLYFKYPEIYHELQLQSYQDKPKFDCPYRQKENQILCPVHLIEVNTPKNSINTHVTEWCKPLKVEKISKIPKGGPFDSAFKASEKCRTIISTHKHVKPITEYMSTISQMGRLIIKKKIHSHDKCNNGKNCLHTFFIKRNKF